MGATDWFGGLDLGAKYGIGLSILFAAVVMFACIKLWIQKRKIRRIKAEQAAKAADEEHKIDQVALTQEREETEGDLFGIRALERGFYGGVAQSRPTTPSLASRSQVTLTPGGNIPYGQNPTLSSSTLALDLGAGSSTYSLGPKKTAASPTVDMSLAVPDSPRAPPKAADNPYGTAKVIDTPSTGNSRVTSPQLRPINLQAIEADAAAYELQDSPPPSQQPYTLVVAPPESRKSTSGSINRVSGSSTGSDQTRKSGSSVEGQGRQQQHPSPLCPGSPWRNRESFAELHESYHENQQPQELHYHVPPRSADPEYMSQSGLEGFRGENQQNDNRFSWQR